MAVTLRKHNATVLESLEPGDTVEVTRGVYSHWGVYVGNGEVVHKTGGNVGVGNTLTGLVGSPCGHAPKKAVIKKENFWDVVGDCKAQKGNRKDGKLKVRPKSEIVDTALSHVSNKAQGYNVLRENCEHFANSCRYDMAVSDQADFLIEGLADVGTLVVMTVAIGLYSIFGGGSKEKERRY